MMITSLQLKKVLIVDDNKTAVDFIAGLVEPLSETVYHTESSRDALAYAANFSIDIAFINYLQPECDGRLCAKQIKEVSPTTKTVLLAADSAVETDALLYWYVDYFLQKPCDRASLMYLVSDLHCIN